MKAAIIGLGKMGTALAKGISRGKSAHLVLCGRDFGKVRALADKLGCSAAKTPLEAVRAADIAIITVKPKDVEALLLEIGAEMKDKLILSIAAGLPCSYFEKRLPRGTRVALAMPSIAVEIGKGATVYFAKSGKDRFLVKELLSPTGILIEAKSEKMLDLALLHGSGIAFFFGAIEGMVAAGVKEGMGEKEALLLCASAAQGAGALILQKGASPRELEESVATKGGITMLGLDALRNAKTGAAFEKAARIVVQEARRRRKKNEKI